MLCYALFPYVPKRFLCVASFEEIALHYMILGFKDGRNVYSRWAARQFAGALAATDMKDVVIVCIPASTTAAHVRRWKRFSSELCRLTGAVNGFDRVQVSGSRKRAHLTGDYELATNIKHYVHIDNDFFRGKRVLVIDDIYTTGQSSAAFIDAMQAVGADVLGALFLGRTKRFCKADRY